MNDQYAQIKSELELTKYELELRVNWSCHNDRNELLSVAEGQNIEKNNVLNKHIKAELHDVKRALVKMEFGLYGICEETGEKIPYDILAIIPTIRTLAEAEAMINFSYIQGEVMLNF